MSTGNYFKTCYVCKKSKPAEAYSAKKCTVDGLQPKCKECTTEYDKQVYQNKRTKRLAQVAARYEVKREQLVAYMHQWRAARPGYDRERYAANPEKGKAKVMRRYAAIVNGTVPWSNLVVIEFFVTTRKWISLETGEPWEIDHIIPLQGKLVSGLHVATNIRVVPALVNLRKRNSFEVT